MCIVYLLLVLLYSVWELNDNDDDDEVGSGWRARGSDRLQLNVIMETASDAAHTFTRWQHALVEPMLQCVPKFKFSFHYRSVVTSLSQRRLSQRRGSSIDAAAWQDYRPQRIRMNRSHSTSSLAHRRRFTSYGVNSWAFCWQFGTRARPDGSSPQAVDTAGT